MRVEVEDDVDLVLDPQAAQPPDLLDLVTGELLDDLERARHVARSLLGRSHAGIVSEPERRREA
jgi:hypothetical protein